MTKVEKEYVMLAVKNLTFVKQPEGFYDNAVIEIDPHWAITLEKILDQITDK